MEEEKNIKGKALYTTKGAAREYGRIGCNFYTGCPHECKYCYLKRGAPSKQLGGTEVRLKKCFKDEQHAADTLCKELEANLEQCQKYGIFLSFTTDPMISETRELTLSAICQTLLHDVPVFILTKNAEFVNNDTFMIWMECIKAEYKHLVHFGFTLTGCDFLEPKASPNLERIKAMRKMKEMGFTTFASIEPVIDWASSEQMVKEAIPWCDHFKLGLMSGTKKDYYDIRESGSAIRRIVQTVNSHNKTIYLKESTRRLLRQYLQPGAYEAFLSLTVDMDGKRIKNDYGKARRTF